MRSQSTSNKTSNRLTEFFLWRIRDKILANFLSHFKTHGLFDLYPHIWLHAIKVFWFHFNSTLWLQHESLHKVFREATSLRSLVARSMNGIVFDICSLQDLISCRWCQHPSICLFALCLILLHNRSQLSPQSGGKYLSVSAESSLNIFARSGLMLLLCPKLLCSVADKNRFITLSIMLPILCLQLGRICYCLSCSILLSVILISGYSFHDLRFISALFTSFKMPRQFHRYASFPRSSEVSEAWLSHIRGRPLSPVAPRVLFLNVLSRTEVSQCVSYSPRHMYDWQ